MPFRCRQGQEGRGQKEEFFSFSFFFRFSLHCPAAEACKKKQRGTVANTHRRESKPLKQSIAKPTPWRERLVLLSASLEFSTFPVQDSANAVYNMSAIKAVLRYVIQFYLMDANIIPKMVCRLKSQMKCRVWASKNRSLSLFPCSAATKNKISVLANGWFYK